VKPKGLLWGSQSTVKKLFAIAFTCVYLTLAVGVVQTTHYCMGRVKSSTLFSFDSVKCPCFVFAKDGNNTCCNDEHEIIKIDDDHAASNAVSVIPAFVVIGEIFEVKNIVQSFPGDEHKIKAPPPLPKIRLFTKHCSLIFYDVESIA